MATGLAAGGAAASPAWASLVATPGQTSGPFYPLELPLDDDNDLTSVDGSSVGATGEVIHVAGRILGIDGTPLEGARVELWQANAAGRYHHPLDSSSRDVDAGFQGFGHTMTTADGAYRFKTIRPGLYPGRTRHLHFAVLAPDGRELVTQMYFAGEPGNAKDGLLRRIGDPAQQQSVIVDFAPADDGSALGQFDMVLA